MAQGHAKRERAIEVIARGVLRAGSKVLLCRNVKRGYYYLPGGHVEPHELANVAVEREFQEETGLNVDCGACGLVAELIFEDRAGSVHEVSVVFHVEHEGGPPPADVRSREAKIAFEWVELAALVEVDFRPGAVKAWLLSADAWGGDGRVVWTSHKA